MATADGEKLILRNGFGDFETRDVYARHNFWVSSGDTTGANYTLSGNAAINTVTHASGLGANSVAAHRLFVKSVAGNLNASSDRPVYHATHATLTVNANLIANAASTLNGPLMVNSDALFAGDILASGDLSVFGDVAVTGAISSEVKTLLLSAASTDVEGAGLYLGNTVASPVASIRYDGDASFNGNAAFKTSLPLLYTGAQTTVDFGTVGAMTVFNTSTPTSFVSVRDMAVSFSDLWRVRYDPTTNAIVFENRATVGDAWVNKFSVNGDL